MFYLPLEYLVLFPFELTSEMDDLISGYLHNINIARNLVQEQKQT